MNPRVIPSVEPASDQNYSESIIVTGNIGAGAKVKVEGNLEVKGKIEAGAVVTATGKIIAATILGPETVLKSENANIQAQIVIGKVALLTPKGCSVIGIQMADASAMMMLFGKSAAAPTAPAAPAKMDKTYDSDEDFSPRSAYF